MRDAATRFRACRWVPDVLAMAVIAVVVWMRSRAAFERGTYLHEGGRWLAEQWNGGVGHALGAIRPDYLTVGNQVVIAVADGLTRLFGGTRLAAAGPMWQHGVSVVWIVAVMMPVWWCLRRNLGLAAAAAAMGMMLVVPEVDGEWVAFGESSNVGFFSATATAFLVWDWWVGREGSRRWGVVSLGWVVVHVLTSPMAALLAGGGAVLMALRGMRGGGRRAVAGWLVLAVIAGLVVVRAATADPYGDAGGGSDGVSLGKARLVERILGRQLLYPLLAPVYEFCEDGVVLAVGGLVAVLGVWVWGEGRRGGLKGQSLWLLGAMACGMAVVTLAARPATSGSAAYASVGPARYFLPQNMVAAACLAAMLCRVAVLRVGLVPVVWSVLAVVAAGSVNCQVVAWRGRTVRVEDTLLRWPAALGRAAMRQTLTGGSGMVRVPIQPGWVAVPVAGEWLGEVRDPGMLAVGFGGVSGGEGEADGGMAAGEPVWSGVPGGMLLRMPLVRSGRGRFSLENARVVLPELPGRVRAAATCVFGPERRERNGRLGQDAMVEVGVFFEGGVRVSEVEKVLGGGLVELAKRNGERLDVVRVPEVPRDGWPWGGFGGVAWAEGGKVVRVEGAPEGLEHLRREGERLHLLEIPETAFEEEEYLRRVPGVEAAVRAGKVSGARAHWEIAGRAMGVEAGVRRFSLRLKEARRCGEIDGLRVVLKRGKGGEEPEGLRCVLMAAGRAVHAVRLVPVEFTGGYRVEWEARGWSAGVAVPDALCDAVEIELVGAGPRRYVVFGGVELLVRE